MAVTAIALSANAERSPFQDKNYLDWGSLKLVGNQLSNKNGDPIQLKGWSTYSLNYKGSCYGEEQWTLMKQYGANIVRLAMPIDDSNDGGSYLAKPDYFKSLIKQSIEEIEKLDMYCIVDWHIQKHSEDESGDPNDYIDESKDFFGEISKYCAENGYDNVLYEICNEPTCGWQKIKSYAEEVAHVITDNQPDAIIIVGTDQWSQKIMEPVSNPIDSLYKKNVMYSFHYDACSHYNFLGDFRAAQRNIPVFVSEWSAFSFGGDSQFCKSNADEMLSDCDNKAAAPQVVSWCLWNWSGVNESSSFFENICGVENLSRYTDGNGRRYSDYVIDLMSGTICCPPPPCCEYWSNPNIIPTTESSLWHWDYYDLGGEGYAYHDLNSGAWLTDSTGAVVDYRSDGEEVDVFSLAKQMMWVDKPCPWSTVENGKVVAFDSTISTMWKDENEKPTYKSLNAGRYYYGTNGSERPDEGVDLYYANCRGTEHANETYSSITFEKGEWINYTVNVAKPGYYKISGIYSAEYGGSVNGEISITSSHGNLLRAPGHLLDKEYVTTFGFPVTHECDDRNVEITSAPWDCWTTSEAKSGKEKEVLCVFGEAGTETITISFNESRAGVGPLIFEFYKELEPKDPFVCGDCGGSDPSAVDDVDATKFSINPNPTSGEFTVTLAENSEASVEVVNMAGQVVASQKIVGSASINKSLTAGVYTVIVKSNGGVSTQKLVVK